MSEKIGTNWTVKRRHLLVDKTDDLPWGQGYSTACGRSITAYDPADESIPRHIRGIDISHLPWCKACEKKRDPK